MSQNEESKIVGSIWFEIAKDIENLNLSDTDFSGNLDDLFINGGNNCFEIYDELIEWQNGVFQYSLPSH